MKNYWIWSIISCDFLPVNERWLVFYQENNFSQKCISPLFFAIFQKVS